MLCLWLSKSRRHVSAYLIVMTLYVVSTISFVTSLAIKKRLRIIGVCRIAYVAFWPVADRYCAATECRLLRVERKSLLRHGGVVVSLVISYF